MKKDMCTRLVAAFAALALVLGCGDQGAKDKVDEQKAAAAEPVAPKPAEPVAPKPVEPEPEPSLPPGVVYKGDPAVGNPEAKVIIWTFTDFQCPVAKRAAVETRQIFGELLSGEVLFVFKHNALKLHQNAKKAALASMAAHAQGKFWEYHYELFAHTNNLGLEKTYTDAAEKLELDMEAFQKTRQDAEVEALIDAQSKLASKLGARGTPAFFFNGRKMVGWASANMIKQWTEVETKAVNKLVAAGKTPKEAIIERVKIHDPKNAKLIIKHLF